MDSKMAARVVGGILIIIAIILGIIQHFVMYNFYGDQSNKWYFWALVAIIFIIGIIIAAWSFAMKEAKPKAPETPQTSQPTAPSQ